MSATPKSSWYIRLKSRLRGVRYKVGKRIDEWRTKHAKLLLTSEEIDRLLSQRITADTGKYGVTATAAVASLIEISPQLIERLNLKPDVAKEANKINAYRFKLVYGKHAGYAPEVAIDVLQRGIQLIDELGNAAEYRPYVEQLAQFRGSWHTTIEYLRTLPADKNIKFEPLSTTMLASFADYKLRQVISNSNYFRYMTTIRKLQNIFREKHATNL